MSTATTHHQVFVKSSLHNTQWQNKDFPQNGNFQACRQGSPKVFKVQGWPQGWVRWVITRSIIFKSFSYMIFKIGPFPHWNPHYKRKWLVIVHFLVYNSENCFVGSFYHLASCVKGTFDSETKSLFWSRLLLSSTISTWQKFNNNVKTHFAFYLGRLYLPTGWFINRHITVYGPSKVYFDILPQPLLRVWVNSLSQPYLLKE